MRMNFTGRLIFGWFLPLGFVAFAAARPWAHSPVNAQDLRKPPSVAVQGGVLPTPLPLFPTNNWWNLDISNAPVDPNSANFITFIGGAARRAHPDFGGEVSPGSANIYGIPYIVVDSTQPKRAVQFDYSDESDGVDHNTDTSFPFYPIPDEAITQAHWIEGGPPGNQNVGGDRHMLIVDKDNKFLYELYSLFYNGSQWTAGSGAFFDMKTNNRRPETWTSADASGLAILPGLVRYDEVYGPDEIKHAFRVTVSATNGYVFPASHAAGTNPSALPMGARLRLKPGKTITGASATPEMLKIVAALKKYGLIVADNGSNLYITGTFDTRWNNGILNPAFQQLTASDFEVIQLGYNPPSLPNLSINDVTLAEGNSGTSLATFTVSLSAISASTVTVNWATANNTATTADADYVANSGSLTFTPGQVSKTVSVTVNGDTSFEASETFFVNLTAPTNAVISDGQGLGTITNDELPPVVTTTAATLITASTATLNATINPNGLATTGSFEYGVTTGYGASTAGTSLGSGNAPVSLNTPVAGLACNSLYHFRARATNVAGTTNGADLTFTTNACLPTVASGAALNVSTTTADLSGNVTSDGGAIITERGIVSSVTGTNPDPLVGGPSVTKTVVAGTTGAFSVTLSPLTPSTAYSFKAYATNSTGTAYGAVATFTTSDPAAPEALVARILSVNSASRSTLSLATSQVWYRVQLFANRSYQLSAWPVDHEQGVDAAKLTATVFSDNLGTVQANGVTGGSGTLEGSPNQGGDDKPFTATIQPTTSGVHKIRVLRVSGGAVPHTVNLMIRETTLFSPWTSRAAGFEGFVEMHNNTTAPINVTLRAYNSLGVLQGGTGLTFSVPANATVFRTATQTGVPVNVFAGIVLTHDGAFGAISANITTLNGANGLSFDSPFTPRAPTVVGPPLR